MHPAQFRFAKYQITQFLGLGDLDADRADRHEDFAPHTGGLRLKRVQIQLALAAGLAEVENGTRNAGHSWLAKQDYTAIKSQTHCVSVALRHLEPAIPMNLFHA